MIRKSHIQWLALLLNVYYAVRTGVAVHVGHWAFLSTWIEGFLFLASLLLWTGWNFARMLVVAGSCAAMSYAILDMLITDSVWASDVAMLLMGMGTVMYLLTPPVVKLFQWGFRVPSWNILLIDDDRVFRRFVSRGFEAVGITIRTAPNGEKGLTEAARERPDVVLLDVIMPGMKGREVCAKLKEDGRTRDVPIIFLTAKNSPDDVSAEQQAGAIVHLTKPIRFPVLYAEIEKLLGR